MKITTKILCTALILVSISTDVLSQETELLSFEKEIERAVVATNLPFLEKAYAEDFRFKHGTGLVDSKESWLKSVEQAKGKYISRVVDSVEVVQKLSVWLETNKIGRVNLLVYNENENSNSPEVSDRTSLIADLLETSADFRAFLTEVFPAQMQTRIVENVTDALANLFIKKAWYSRIS